MSCNADKVLQTLVQRELQRRVNDLKAMMRQRMREFASKHKLPQPQQIAAAAASTIVSSVATEALRRQLASMAPPVDWEAREAYQEKLLSSWHDQLLDSGADPIKAAEFIENERCLFHVANALESGELIEGAIAELE